MSIIQEVPNAASLVQVTICLLHRAMQCKGDTFLLIGCHYLIFTLYIQHSGTN